MSVKKLVADIFMVGAALALVRQKRPDIIHAGEEAVFIALLLKRWLGIPYIYDMDSGLAEQTATKWAFLRPFRRALDRVERAALSEAAAAAPVCNALADLARDQGAPFVETLYDISQLGGPSQKPEGHLRQSLNVQGQLLVYVGNLERYQGVDLLLESFSKAEGDGLPVELVIAGGQQRHIRHYEAKSRSLGISERVHFIGPWPANRLDELLAEADILVSPRIAMSNTPMKIFPYLHSGKPVLVTDLPTHNQILDDTVALLAPPEPAEFGRAIRLLVENPELRAELGRAGVTFVEKQHTFDAHRRRVRRLYEYVESRVRTDTAEPSASEIPSYTASARGAAAEDR
jgi:glycosyltransferase involved in cell wall biosynthesis